MDGSLHIMLGGFEFRTAKRKKWRRLHLPISFLLPLYWMYVFLMGALFSVFMEVGTNATKH